MVEELYPCQCTAAVRADKVPWLLNLGAIAIAQERPALLKSPSSGALGQPPVRPREVLA
jgi:hypothetical protein